MRRWTVVVLAALVATAACGDDDDDDDAAPEPSTTTTTTAPSTTTTAPPEPLTVLVTNDDGVAAAGIDALVEALSDDTRLELVIVAPAENQSGSGDSTTPGGAPASDATTASGREAVAVAGEPGDAVVHGLDVVLADDPPDLVISGINEGQNLGPIVDLSGTVGAARIAARQGIPALAVSAGLAPEGLEPDYGSSVTAVETWLDENLAGLSAGQLVSINVPTCPTGEIRGTVEVPTATDTADGNPVDIADCASSLTDPATDIAGFNAGYIVVSEPGLG